MHEVGEVYLHRVPAHAPADVAPTTGGIRLRDALYRQVPVCLADGTGVNMRPLAASARRRVAAAEVLRADIDLTAAVAPAVPVGTAAACLCRCDDDQAAEALPGQVDALCHFASSRARWSVAAFQICSKVPPV